MLRFSTTLRVLRFSAMLRVLRFSASLRVLRFSATLGKTAPFDYAQGAEVFDFARKDSTLRLRSGC
ncbi:MAG: hypothetical protein ACP5O2_05715 [Bacteroidales bacterium]